MHSVYSEVMLDYNMVQPNIRTQPFSPPISAMVEGAVDSSPASRSLRKWTQRVFAHSPVTGKAGRCWRSWPEAHVCCPTTMTIGKAALIEIVRAKTSFTNDVHFIVDFCQDQSTVDRGQVHSVVQAIGFC
jgi:hypothetical protein